MSFKLTHTNKNGTFKVVLNRDPDASEITAICQLAINLVPCEEATGMSEQEYFGPPRPNNDLYTHIKDGEFSSITQSKLGEKPVSSIKMGEYVEPTDGVRIKMLALVSIGRVAAFKAFREETGISLVGCKEIVYGNYPCPVLTLDVAKRILERLQAAEVYAKIVPAFEAAA